MSDTVLYDINNEKKIYKNTDKVYLNFNTFIIPHEDEKKIMKIILNSQYPYANITNKIMKKVNKINLLIGPDLLNSMKGSIIKNNMIIQYAHLKINNTQIAEEYVKSNVLNLSKKYNASPINIIRVVFIHRGMNNKEIRKLFFNTNRMNEYDKTQFELAVKYDNYGFVDDNKISELSLKFEKEIEEILKKNNVVYKTQQQLTDEQSAEGNVYSTPDFLILSELYINGKKINWIDAKNYYGFYNNFVIGKIKKQTAKYINLYGDGCIVFKYGFSSKIKFDNIICVNL
jgi:hypothetical protein